MLSNGPTGSSEGRLPHPPTPDPTQPNPTQPPRILCRLSLTHPSRARSHAAGSRPHETFRVAPYAARHEQGDGLSREKTGLPCILTCFETSGPKTQARASVLATLGVFLSATDHASEPLTPSSAVIVPWDVRSRALNERTPRPAAAHTKTPVGGHRHQRRRSRPLRQRPRCPATTA